MRIAPIGWSHILKIFVSLSTAFLLISPGNTAAAGLGITITEIHYHPPGASEAALEFVEIYNQDPTPFDLGGYRFTDGIEFEFPAATFLPGRSYLAVAANQAALEAIHPGARIIGNFTGRLDNSGEELALANDAGVTVVKVGYNDAGRWPHAADGTGHSLSIRGVFLDPSESESWSASSELGGTPGRANFPTETVFLDLDIIADGQDWSYRKGTSAPSSPANAWRTAAFDDASWPPGAAGFGYGDDDDRTVLADMANGYFSVFIRHRFNLSAADFSADESLVLLIRYDDAFVAYLNGVEAARSGIGAPGDSTPFDAPGAINHEAGGFEAFTLAKNLLQGGNVLAIQGHNAALNSTDFSLQPMLVRRRGIPPPAPSASPVVLNELFPGNGGRWLELFNTAETPFDLNGCWLSNDAGTLRMGAVKPGPPVPARGYMLLGEADLPFPLAIPPAGGLSIFLTTPAGDRVVDARRFEAPRETGASIARVADGDAGWSEAAEPTAGAPNRVAVENDVIINEIHYHPHQGSLAALGAAGTSLEFIELYNRGGHPIDLSGYAFTKGIRYDFPEGTAVQPDGYLVIAADPAAILAAHGLEGVLGPYEGVLADDGENLVLEDGRGNVVDAVHYRDDGNWSRWADGGGSSLELLDPRQDNGSGSAWAASDESGKAAWKSVTYPGVSAGGESELHIILQHRGEVLIDEIRISGNGVANYLPNGHFDAGVEGWIFEGTHVHAGRTEDPTYAGAGALRLVSSGRGDSRVNKIECNTSPALPGNVTFSISYAGRWVRGTNLVTTRGSNHGFPRTIELPVPRNTGTPGARNSAAAGNLGPLIDSARQVPIVADAGQRVTILARIGDSDGIASARILYKLDGSPGSFGSAALFDDGVHGDGLPADGTFAGEVPGFALGARIAFYIEAVDALGAARTFPEDAPQRTLLYQVDVPGLLSPAHNYRLVLSAAATQTLETRKALSNDLVEGTFVFENSEAYYNVGVRYRGSPWLRPGNPKSYRIRLNKDEPFHGSKKVNLDVTGWELRERAAFYMVRGNSGGIRVPYSQQAHAVLRFNGARLWLYEHTQQIDRGYVDYWFPGDNDGDLYKIDLRMDIDDSYATANVRNLWLDYINNDEEQYRYNFSLRTNEEKDSHASLMTLARMMDPAITSDATFRLNVENLVDVEEWLRVLSVRIFNDDWDTYGLGAKNAYLYYASVEGRWRLLPWDSDNTFGNINAPLWPNDFYQDLVRLFNTPAYRRLYFRLIDALSGSPATANRLSAYLDPTRAAMLAEGVGNPAGIYGFVASRGPVARSILPSPSPFRITSPSPLSTAASSVSILGTAPYAMASMVLRDAGGDSIVKPAWSQPQNWSLPVFVHPGDNALELFAYGEDGGLIGSASIVVHSTAVWNPPEVAAVEPSGGPEEGGNAVTLTGSGFQRGAAVFFGLKPASGVELAQTAQPPRVDILAVAPTGEGTVDITVVNQDGKSGTLALGYSYQSLNNPFKRGDSTGDLLIEILDAVAILEHLFRQEPLLCLDAGDANDDGSIDISDAVRLLLYLFLGAAPPPPPFDAVGPDPTPDPLVCRG